MKLKKKFLICLLMNTIILLGPITVSAKEITIEDTTIQEVIDADTTLDGDTIILTKDKYTENIVINKNLTIKGNSEKNTIINGKITINNDSTIENITISTTGSEGIEIAKPVEFNLSNSKIEYTNYTEGDYGNSDYFSGIWLNKTADGTMLTVNNVEINAKYGIWVNGENNVVEIKNSTITGYAPLDISNGMNSTTLAEGNYVTVSNSTLTGITAGEGENNAYGTIVIGGQNTLILNIINSTITNKFIEKNNHDLIVFASSYLPSEGVIINISNSKLKNNDSTGESAVVNFTTEDNAFGDNMIITDFATVITSLNQKIIEKPEETIIFTLSSIEGDVTVILGKGSYIDIDALTPEEVEGYTFEGWYTDSNYTTKFIEDTTIDTDTTIYAKFTKIEDITKTEIVVDAVEEPSTQVVENVQTGDINLILVISLIIITGIGLVLTGKKILAKKILN